MGNRTLTNKTIQQALILKAKTKKHIMLLSLSGIHIGTYIFSKFWMTKRNKYLGASLWGFCLQFTVAVCSSSDCWGKSRRWQPNIITSILKYIYGRLLLRWLQLADQWFVFLGQTKNLSRKNKSVLAITSNFWISNRKQQKKKTKAPVFVLVLFR